MGKPAFCLCENKDSYRRWLEALNFGFRKKRDGTIYQVKTKALISFAVTAKLICIFVFAYAKCWFSHDAAHMCFRLPPIRYENLKSIQYLLVP